MSLPPDTRADLDALISAHLDATLTSDAAMRLNLLLAHEAEARRIYFDSMALHALLLWGEGAAVPRQAPLMPMHTAARWRSWGVPLAACLALSAALALVVSRRPHDGPPPAEQTAALPPIIASIASSQACAWAAGTLPTTVGSQLTSGTLQLITGQAVISFASGAVLVLAGPATVELESGKRAFLRSGLIAAEVPAPARGFTVDTTNGTITDLGTRFGLEVAADGASTLLTVVGALSVRPRSAPLAAPILLHAGESLALDREGIASAVVPGDPARFAVALAALGHSQPQADTGGEYCVAVLEDRTLGYWRCNEDPASGVREVADRSPAHHSGSMHGGLRSIPGVPGIGGRALAFDGSTGYISIPHRPDYSTLELSVEFWLATSEPWTHPWWPGDAILISKDVPGAANHDWSVIGGSVGAGQRGGRVIVGVGVQQSDELLSSPTALNDGRWHQVVWTRDAAGLSLLYVDGRTVGRMQGRRGAINNPLDIEIGGGTRSEGAVPGAHVAVDLHGVALGDRLFLQGALAEIALYGQVLGADRVAAHYRLAATSAGTP